MDNERNEDNIVGFFSVLALSEFVVHRDVMVSIM